MTAAALPVWRSLLFVPVTAKRFVDGAARRGADAIILDLEDSVAASEKERARAPVPEAAEIVSRGGADVVVRINRPLRLAVRDIEAAVGPGVLALALPKVDGPSMCGCSPRSSTRSKLSTVWRWARPASSQWSRPPRRSSVSPRSPALIHGSAPSISAPKISDVPVVERARLLLERETTIAAREARMRQSSVAVS